MPCCTICLRNRLKVPIRFRTAALTAFLQRGRHNRPSPARRRSLCGWRGPSPCCRRSVAATLACRWRRTVTTSTAKDSSPSTARPRSRLSRRTCRQSSTAVTSSAQTARVHMHLSLAPPPGRRLRAYRLRPLRTSPDSVQCYIQAELTVIYDGTEN